LFLAALAIFHAFEYIAIALFNPTKLTLDSFLLNHSPEYTMATIGGVTEFLIELYFFPQLKTWGWLNKVGLIIVVIGQAARTLAMFSAKSNFSHYVEFYKEEHHVLVTDGIYSLLRHPSYFGFYYWALGSQLMMMNPICFVGYGAVLHYFFSDRIFQEEQLLIRFFGQDYRDYKAKTKTGLPFI
ncbi:Isoprenylcysteine carboxyl methyltransferase family-domain-containing protein, partial [Lobosporangium transversale]